jgi:hypothetical protein
MKILVVPAGLSENLLRMAAEGELSPETAIKLFEADVDVLVQSQGK